MQIASVLGQTTATVKHDTLKGWRMLIVQPLDAQGADDGFPFMAIDNHGARRGDRVLITSDGHGVREMIGSKRTPVRWAVMGVIDE